MNKEITDKTVVLVTRNLGNVWLRPEQAEAVKMAILSDKKYITIGDDLIMLNDVVGIKSGEAIKDLERAKQGEWKCKYNEWHAKNEQCGHGLL